MCAHKCISILEVCVYNCVCNYQIYLWNPTYAQSCVCRTWNIPLSHEPCTYKFKLTNNYVKFRNQIALGIFKLHLHLLIHIPQQDILSLSSCPFEYLRDDHRSQHIAPDCQHALHFQNLMNLLINLHNILVKWIIIIFTAFYSRERDEPLLKYKITQDISEI